MSNVGTNKVQISETVSNAGIPASFVPSFGYGIPGYDQVRVGIGRMPIKRDFEINKGLYFPLTSDDGVTYFARISGSGSRQAIDLRLPNSMGKEEAIGKVLGYITNEPPPH